MATVRRAFLLDVAPLLPGALAAAGRAAAPHPSPAVSAAFRTRRAAATCVLRPAPSSRTLVITACRQQHASHGPRDASHPNAAITKCLEEYKEYLRHHGAMKFRIVACARAIAVLQEQEYPIQSGAEAVKLKGIGLSLARKIDEILSTGRLNALAPERVEGARYFPRSLSLFAENDYNILASPAVEELKKVSGMSQEQAEEYVDKGVRSLADLKCFESSLDERQKLGLAAVNELSQDLPAAEAKAIEEALRKAGTQWDSHLTIHLVGPCSRGQPVTGKGELEFLLVHPLYTNEEAAKYAESANPMVTSFADKLRADGLMVDNIPPVEADTYFAVMKMPGSNVRRLVTLRGCTVEQSPMALLCMTQPPEFETKLRKRASERGLKCERFELVFDDCKGTSAGRKRKKTAEAKTDRNRATKRKLPVSSEEDLLKQLGLHLNVPLIRNKTAAPGGTIQ